LRLPSAASPRSTSLSSFASTHAPLRNRCVLLGEQADRSGFPIRTKSTPHSSRQVSSLPSNTGFLMAEIASCFSRTPETDTDNARPKHSIAVTNARFAPFHCLWIGPVSLSTTSVPLPKPRARHECHWQSCRKSGGFRLRFGSGVALRLRSGRLFSPPRLHAPADRRPKPEVQSRGRFSGFRSSLTRPPPPGVFASRFSSRRSLARRRGHRVDD
jgi:hypothetical protein